MIRPLISRYLLDHSIGSALNTYSTNHFGGGLSISAISVHWLMGLGSSFISISFGAFRCLLTTNHWSHVQNLGKIYSLQHAKIVYICTLRFKMASLAPTDYMTLECVPVSASVWSHPFRVQYTSQTGHPYSPQIFVARIAFCVCNRRLPGLATYCNVTSRMNERSNPRNPYVLWNDFLEWGPG